MPQQQSHDLEVLKDVVTARTLTVEPKGIDAFTIPNAANLFACSNHDFPIMLGLHARRYAVFKISDARLDDQEYFDNLNRVLDHPDTPRPLADVPTAVPKPDPAPAPGGYHSDDLRQDGQSAILRPPSAPVVGVGDQDLPRGATEPVGRHGPWLGVGANRRRPLEGLPQVGPITSKKSARWPKRSSLSSSGNTLRIAGQSTECATRWATRRCHLAWAEIDKPHIFFVGV